MFRVLGLSLLVCFIAFMTMWLTYDALPARIPFRKLYRRIAYTLHNKGKDQAYSPCEQPNEHVDTSGLPTAGSSRPGPSSDVL